MEYGEGIAVEEKKVTIPMVEQVYLHKTGDAYKMEMIHTTLRHHAWAVIRAAEGTTQQQAVRDALESLRQVLCLETDLPFGGI